MHCKINQEATSLLDCLLIDSTFLVNRIDDSPDVCVDYLLDTATKSSPYFDWAIVHISYVKLLENTL